jgi:hypothetical protein
MADYVVDQNAAVQCLHAGQARPLTVDQRVKAGGQNIVTQSSSYSISACSLGSTSSPPCATATFVTAATRVKASGQPVILKTSQATCVPTGTGLTIISTQVRVKGT